MDLNSLTPVTARRLLLACDARTVAREKRIRKEIEALIQKEVEGGHYERRWFPWPRRVRVRDLTRQEAIEGLKVSFHGWPSQWDSVERIGRENANRVALVRAGAECVSPDTLVYVADAAMACLNEYLCHIK